VSRFDLGRLGFMGAHGVVDVDGEHLRVHVDPWFRVDVPRSVVTSVDIVTPSWLAGFGVHHWRGAWVVDGRREDAVDVKLSEPVRGRMLGIPVRVRRLQLGVEDLDGLKSALT
jgi:hypothetical protein